MRRESIYPHRSVRSFPISGIRLFAALAIALSLCALVVYSSTKILRAHNEVTSYVLEKTRVDGVKAELEVFPHLGAVPVPELPFADARATPLRTAIMFALFFAGLMMIHWRFPLSRNFVIFLVVLLCAAGVVILTCPWFRLDSRMFAQIWLRGEFLVWLLLPWISAFLFIVTLPSVTAGIGWSLLIEIYAVLWSAIRFAFCLGVLHFTGMLFLPLLWFSLGILFDLVYVLTFFSLALRWSMKRAVGERQV